MVPSGRRRRVKQACTALYGLSTVVTDKWRGPRTVVLCYHSISDTGSFLSVTPGGFRTQLRRLKSEGFSFASIRDVARELRAGRISQEKRAVITFDDGYRDNYEHALPVLLEEEVPATFFVTTGLLGRDDAITSQFAQITGREWQFLGAGQLRDLRRQGFEVGSHAHSHRNLARAPAEDVEWELTHSKTVLEDILSEEVDMFAYPFGQPKIHYTAEVVRQVRETGYAAACSIIFRGMRPRDSTREYQIPRISVTPYDDEKAFLDKVQGRMDWLGYWHEWSPSWAKAKLSAVSPMGKRQVGVAPRR